MKEFIDKVFDNLSKMESDEFTEKLEEHKNGDIARILLDIGYFEYFDASRNAFPYEQLPLFQGAFDIGRKAPAGSDVNIKGYFDELPIEPETINIDSQTAESSLIDVNAIHYSIEYPVAFKTGYPKRNGSNEFEIATTVTDIINNESDDYGYEYAA